MSKNGNNGTSKTSLIILIGYLISSIFAGLIFSGLTIRARNEGNSGIGWAILSLICIGIFGFMGYAFFKTSFQTYFTTTLVLLHWLLMV
jgi:hypothetical protein